MTATKRRIRQRPEEALHIAVARYLDVALPDDATWFHVPNGGARNVVVAAKLKAMGVKAGVFDIIIIWRGRTFALELKADKGRPSAAQVAWHNKLANAGGLGWYCRTVEEVEDVLRHIGMRLYATVYGKGTERSAP